MFFSCEALVIERGRSSGSASTLGDSMVCGCGRRKCTGRREKEAGALEDRVPTCLLHTPWSSRVPRLVNAVAGRWWSLSASGASLHVELHAPRDIQGGGSLEMSTGVEICHATRGDSVGSPPSVLAKGNSGCRIRVGKYFLGRLSAWADLFTAGGERIFLSSRRTMLSNAGDNEMAFIRSSPSIRVTPHLRMLVGASFASRR